MPISASILDIGGVLRLTADTGWHRRWCTASASRPVILAGDVEAAGRLGMRGVVFNSPERAVAAVVAMLKPAT